MKRLFGMIVSLPVVYGMLLITASIWCMPDSAQAVQFTLTVSKAGTGLGTVTSSPAGITCDSICIAKTASFDQDTIVTLTASPPTGSDFTGWSGEGCSGTGTCTVHILAASSVRATFTLQQFPLTVSKAGAGSGTVTSNPAGITCGSTCSAPFGFGNEVTLTAVATNGSTFAGWSGEGCSGTSTCTVSMTQAHTVTATFNLVQFPLTVRKAGTGSGTVTSSPAGIDCGSTCSARFDFNTSVTLTATADNGLIFAGWSVTGLAGCSGTSPCTVSVTQARTVTAIFNVQPFTLTVVKEGTGSGTVTSSPTGITCGSTCSAPFNSNTSVTLTAVAASDSTFDSWRGVGCSGTGSCTVSITQAPNVTATFTLRSVPNLPPIADAGPDQTVIEGTLVTLDGSNSRDSDGTIASFAWQQTAGTPVILSNPAAVQPTFTAPLVSLSEAFQAGDRVPGFVLTTNPAGSIADVRARGTYTASTWTVMFTRALTTLDPDGDVQFNLTNPANLYFFSIAYLDNTGAAPPDASAVMTTQDTTPYTLGNETSQANLRAKQETPTDCSAFTGTPLVTTPPDPVVPRLTLRAAYDAQNFYLCVIAPDPNGVADVLKEHWEFLGPTSSDWEQKSAVENVMGGEPGKFDEDSIAIFWNINAQDFQTQGCTALCHATRMQSKNPDGRADLWHWKAATTNPAGFAEDQRLDPDKSRCPENPCRQKDAATVEIARENKRIFDAAHMPAFVAVNNPRAAVSFLFQEQVPLDCPPGACALAIPFGLRNEVLQFALTVTDNGGLSGTDSVAVKVTEDVTRDEDVDGLSNAVEDAAPNGGDGNLDGILDSQQENVASLPNSVNRSYVTLVSPAGTRLATVRAIDNPSPSDTPPDTVFPLGFFAFTVQRVATGGATTVTLMLPPGIVANQYFKFGATPDTRSEHWYAFLFDGTTGAEILSDRVILHFVDGQRGDDDLTANGEIEDAGALAITTTTAPPTAPPSGGGGGGGGGCAMDPGASFDPMLVVSLGVLFAYVAWRHIRKRSLF